MEELVRSILLRNIGVGGVGYVVVTRTKTSVFIFGVKNVVELGHIDIMWLVICDAFVKAREGRGDGFLCSVNERKAVCYVRRHPEAWPFNLV